MSDTPHMQEHLLPACANVDDKLLDYVYAELPREEHELVAAHVAGCARCQAELAAYGAVRRVARASQLVEPPAAATAKLLYQAAQRAPRQAPIGVGKVLPFVRRTIRHPGFAMAAAFIVVGGAVGWQMMVKGGIAMAPPRPATTAATPAATTPATSGNAETGLAKQSAAAGGALPQAPSTVAAAPAEEAPAGAKALADKPAAGSLDGEPRSSAGKSADAPAATPLKVGAVTSKGGFFGGFGSRGASNYADGAGLGDRSAAVAAPANGPEGVELASPKAKKKMANEQLDLDALAKSERVADERKPAPQHHAAPQAEEREVVAENQVAPSPDTPAEKERRLGKDQNQDLARSIAESRQRSRDDESGRPATSEPVAQPPAASPPPSVQAQAPSPSTPLAQGPAQPPGRAPVGHAASMRQQAPQDPSQLARSAAQLAQEGDCRGAARAFQQLHASFPQFAETHGDRLAEARCARALGNYVAAGAELDRLSGDAPELSGQINDELRRLNDQELSQRASRKAKTAAPQPAAKPAAAAPSKAADMKSSF